MSRQALWPSAQASQLLPTPVGPHRIRLSCASIQSPVGELLEQRAIEAARGAVIDILDERLDGAAWHSAAGRQPPVAPIADLAIEQQGEPFGMGEGRGFAGGFEFAEGLGHAGKAELVELIEDGMGEQGSVS